MTPKPSGKSLKASCNFWETKGDSIDTTSCHIVDYTTIHIEILHCKTYSMVLWYSMGTVLLQTEEKTLEDSCKKKTECKNRCKICLLQCTTTWNYSTVHRHKAIVLQYVRKKSSLTSQHVIYIIMQNSKQKNNQDNNKLHLYNAWCTVSKHFT